MSSERITGVKRGRCSEVEIEYDNSTTFDPPTTERKPITVKVEELREPCETSTVSKIVTKIHPPWAPDHGMEMTVPKDLVVLHTTIEEESTTDSSLCIEECPTIRDIKWMSTPEVAKTLTSDCRYGDTDTGMSFMSIFNELKSYWTASRIREFIVPVSESTFPASGRVIEWAHTNYCAAYPFLDNRGDNVSVSYANELRRTQRRKFDTYVRVGSPFIFMCLHSDAGQKMVRTSVAQLHFFKWSISRGIMERIVSNVSDIKMHMRQTLKNRKKEGSAKKRQKLCADVKMNSWAAGSNVTEKLSL